MLVALMPVLPFGVASGGFQLLTPYLLLSALLAPFSDVLPFLQEIHALNTMPTRTYSILLRLKPVAAALSGWLLLGQRPATGQWLAEAYIAAMSVGAPQTARCPVRLVAGE